MNVFFTKLKEKQSKAKSEKAYTNLKNRLRYSTGRIKTASLCVNTDKGYEELIRRLTEEGYECSIDGDKKNGWFITVKGE